MSNQVNQIVSVISRSIGGEVSTELREVIRHAVKSELGRHGLDNVSRVSPSGKYSLKEGTIVGLKLAGKVGGKGDKVALTPMGSLVFYIERLLAVGKEYGTDEENSTVAFDLEGSRWEYLIGTWKHTVARQKAEEEAKKQAEAKEYGV